MAGGFVADERRDGDGGQAGRSRISAAVDWFFRDPATNRITIAQFPNLPLGVFLVSVGVGWLIPASSKAHDAFGVIGTAGLAWWSIDEMVRGVNPWRRVLGAIGSVFVVMRVLRIFT